MTPLVVPALFDMDWKENGKIEGNQDIDVSGKQMREMKYGII